jgi:hypothetical protein
LPGEKLNSKIEVEFAIGKREKERRKGGLKVSICMHWNVTVTSLTVK